jgi:hypothetical protein
VELHGKPGIAGPEHFTSLENVMRFENIGLRCNFFLERARLRIKVRPGVKFRPEKKPNARMSRVYPERKWRKEKRHDIEKRNLNRLKQISILARGITRRKPDIGRSVEQENAAQHKINKRD